MIPKIPQAILHYRLHIESVLAVVTIASLLLFYSGFNGADSLVMLTSSTLAVYYFIEAYFPSEFEGMLLATIGTKMAGIASSVCVIGILFTTLQMPGSENMLVIGMASMCIAGLIFLYNYGATRNSKLVPVLLRILILGSITGYLLYASKPAI